MSVKPPVHPKGSAIIFVLLIMLVAMIITTTVSTIVLSNLRTAVAYNENARATYAGESGLERGLYYLQYARDAKTIGATASLEAIGDFTGAFNNDAGYTMETDFVDDSSADNLDVLDVVQRDLYAEDYTSGYRLEPMADLNSAEITWSESATCTPLSSQVEVSFSAWTEFEWEDITDPSTLVTHYTVSCPGPGVGDPECAGYIIGLDSTYLYKIRVQALNCPIENVRITPLNSLGEAIPMTDAIVLESTGTYGNSARTGGVSLPWNPALSRYFEYVIFAEDAISK